jgi:hypothetical protein
MTFEPKAPEQYGNVGDMAGLGWLTQHMQCMACRQKEIAGNKSSSRAIVEVFLAAAKVCFFDEEEALE